MTTSGKSISFGSIWSTVRRPLMKCAGGSTCVPHWPTCVKSSEKNPEPIVSGRLSYQQIVLRVSSGKPGQRGIPGANSCVRSTYFFDASTFCIFHSGLSSAPHTDELTKSKSSARTRTHSKSFPKQKERGSVLHEMLLACDASLHRFTEVSFRIRLC